MSYFILFSTTLVICTAGCGTLLSVQAGSAAPQFAVHNQEFSVCVPNFSGRIGAIDPDGDRVIYSLLGTSTAALDYVIDTATGLVRSIRPFNASEKSVLTIQAIDQEKRSSTTTITILYSDCGASVAEPVDLSEARAIEPIPNLPADEGLPVLGQPNKKVKLVKHSGSNTIQRAKLVAALSIKTITPRYGGRYTLGVPNLWPSSYYGRYPFSYYRPFPFVNPAVRPTNVCPVTFVDRTGLVYAGTIVAWISASGGIGNYHFTSLDSRFSVSPSGLTTADVTTKVPLPAGDFPFLVRIQDGGGSSIEIYVKVCIR